MDDADNNYNHDRTPASTTEPVSFCRCLVPETSSEQVVLPERQERVFSAVVRTENYLRERRIPDLIRFLFSKIIANRDSPPAQYTQKLLDDCMLFRAGLGKAPVLFEDRHLEAVVKSFDPGEKGWLSAGQVRRAYITLGLVPKENLPERNPTELVLSDLKETQEQELYNLLSAGTMVNSRT